MKKIPKPFRPYLFALVGIVLMLSSVAFGSANAVSLSATPTPTPTPDINLDVGSTDGIFVWAVIILLIIITPILWDWTLSMRKKKNLR